MFIQNPHIRKFSAVFPQIFLHAAARAVAQPPRRRRASVGAGLCVDGMCTYCVIGCLVGGIGVPTVGTSCMPVSVLGR